MCRGCDRGHVYCSDACRLAGIQLSARLANRRHQRSRDGARDHAKRQARYRDRIRQKVTDVGSGKVDGTPTTPMAPTHVSPGALEVVDGETMRGSGPDVGPDLSPAGLGGPGSPQSGVAAAAAGDAGAPGGAPERAERLFFRMPVSAVLIVDAWGGSPGPDSSSVINVHRAVPDCPQARHDARAARVKP